MSFNYTKTLQQLYGVRVVKHIHNRVGQKLVFGHGDDRAEYEEPYDEEWRAPVGATDLNDFIQFLRKDTDKQLRKYNDFFRKLSPEIDKVYSYGFSYSKVDSPYIKEVIRRISPNATWYFTAHEANNAKEFGKKKSKLRRYGFKGKFDVYRPGERIVDLKTAKDLQPMYKPGEGRLSFADYWNWPLQMAIYQALEGNRLPCYLAVITKEDPPDLALVEIEQEKLDAEMDFLLEKLPYFDAIKQGVIEPERCENCAWCRMSRKLTGPRPLESYIEIGGNNE